MKQDKQKHNWLIDAALFGGFLGSLWLDLTGVAVHQWLGLAVGALATYHLVKHWRWVKAVSARFLGRTSKQSRTFYAVDAGLAVGFAAIMVTGVVISTWLDLTLASYATWHTVHVAASVAALALLVAKIGLHWRWIIDVARRRVFQVQTPAPAAARQVGVALPAPVAAQPSRRDFIRLMAGVGAVALLAGANALGSVGDGGAEASAAQTTGGTQKPVGASSASSASTSSARSVNTCSVHCGRHCSYPGHCRKYTDSNNNGWCDLGECLS